MSRLRLSAPAAESLLPLVQLPLSAVTAIVEALRARLAVRLQIDQDLAEALQACEAIGEAGEEQRHGLASAIYGLHFLCVSADKADLDLASDVADVLAKEVEQSSAEIAEKIALVLSLESVRTSVKAWSLLEDYRDVYLSSRVITDIRPVFGDDLSRPLSASLIVHTIKLTVRSDGENKDVFIVADGDDLKSLITDLQRGLEKATSLRRMIKDSDKFFGQYLESSDES